MRFERYTVTVPVGWEARRAEEEPGHSTLVLVPPNRTLLCRLEVIRSDRELAASEVDAFLEMARQDFRGSRETPVRMRTPVAHLRGFAVREAVEAKSRIVGALSGESEIEVYAGIAGRELVAAIAGGWSRDPAGRHLRDECLRALKSLRIP
ncbi:MAG: hypothetical protein HYY06_04755 [Deltaproteobacteria bacterium]|nr:hypothetical protein [Deltaproteobacteria bacterium]